jgi:hypothetical protein
MPQVQYYVNLNGQNLGPYNLNQLQQMATAGQLQPTTYVWKNGMSNWILAKDSPELASLFSQMPPPPPVPPTL